MKRAFLTALGVMTLMVGAASNAAAVELIGTFGTTGSARITAGSIDWFPRNDNGGPNIEGQGTVVILEPVDGYFLFPGSGVGSISDPFQDVRGTILDIAEVATPGFSTAPINTPINVTNFLSGLIDTNGANNLNPEYSDFAFDLTFIPLATTSNGACTGAAIAIGTTCDVGAFSILQATANTLTISFNMRGTFRDPSLLLENNRGTAAFSNQGILRGSTGNNVGTVTELFAELLLPTGFVESTFSGTFTAPPDVPEPATLLLLGSGSALLAARARRRRNKNVVA